MRQLIFRTCASLSVTLALVAARAGSGPAAFAPTGFIPNLGQFVDASGAPVPGLAFLFQGDGLNIQLRQGGFSYEAWHAERSDRDTNAVGDVRVHRIDVKLEDSDHAAHWEAMDPSADVINYYTTGTGEAGITGVHHYGRVVCRSIYPFIDLVFSTTADGRSAKYDLIIHPGGEPSRIRMRYSGAYSELHGSAVALAWSDGLLHDDVPKSYWQKGDARTITHVIPKRIEDDHYTFELNGDAQPWTFGASLVIDPVPTLQWGTYYGNGDHNGSLNALAIDLNGNTIAAGTAGITGLATWGAHDMVLSGSTDALLVKLNSSGQRVWATYYGGSSNEVGRAVDVDDAGVIYLAGDTWSSGSIATTGAHQTTLSGTTDSFLAKFNTNGVRQWSTYYGGTGEDRAYALVVDGAGKPAIAGTTTSITGIAAPGAADPSYGGSGDAFVAKFHASGVRQWATYLGGSGQDDATGLGCDGTYFFVCGSTSSTNGIALGATHQTSLNTVGSQPRDAYVVKYSGLGLKMWGSYFGGSGADYARACFAELQTGNIYFAGETFSTNGIASAGSHQTGFAGGGDAFLAKFDFVGAREWSTYLGGSNGDEINAVSVGSMGRVMVAGSTGSTTNMATGNAAYPALGGGTDAFINCFSAAGSRLWGTYYGGTGYDGAYALAVDGFDLAIGGLTGSSSGIATPGTFQPSATVSSGNYAKYVASFTAPMFFAKSHDPLEEAAGLVVRADAGGANLVVPAALSDGVAGPLMIRIVDAMGREVYVSGSTPQGTVVQLPWHELAAGAYSVVVEGAGRRWATRMVKP